MDVWQSMSGTTAAVAIYLLTFIAVLKTDELPGLPKSNNQRGLNLSTAWQDLHIITTHPHPFNSHANDVVHAYLLGRLEPIAATYSHVHVVDDRVSNASYEQIYFEGTNILVKVDGTAEDLQGAVLFSAHYDSVSTASGATDDGMAIVSMVQMVEKLAKTRSQRTAIFNFNNGEEDGLNGAHAFLEHPWSNLTETFLNLEGAGFGSRPILFRGTSTKPLRAFHHNYVSHPHGTILAGDAFSTGIIRSRTDYSVYAEGGGMQGLDFAFYKGRSYYHTKYDAIPFLKGGTRALWSMMEALDAAGHALLDQDDGEPSSPGDVVYFDLFGRLMVMFPLATMQTINLILLITVPVVTIGLFVRRRLSETQMRHGGIFNRVWQSEGKSDFCWIRFWIGLVAVVASQATFVLGCLKSNKYVVYSLPHTVIASAIFLVYLVFSSIITSSSLPFLRDYPPSTSDPNILLLQLVVLYYLVLLATTLFLPIGGTYLFTAFTACAFLGWLAGAVGRAIDNPDLVHQSETAPTEEFREDQQPTEYTPLLQHSSGIATDGDRRPRALWFVQLLLVVLVPVILLSHIGIILLGAMPQGVVDGGPVWIVYAGISLVATLLILPLAPFMASYPYAGPLALAPPFQYASSPKTLFRAVLVAFLISVAYISGFLGILLSPTSSPSTRHGFPFSINSPMKVFFQQKVEILAPWVTQEVDDPTSLGSKTRSTTYLTGLPHYLEKMLVPALPSAVDSSVECVRDNDRKGLFRCGWSSGDSMLPWPGKNISASTYRPDTALHTQVLTHNPWLQSRIQVSSTNTRRIWIRGTNTRTCRVYFDNAKVAKWSVVGGKPGVQKGYEGFETNRGEGLTELRVWSRTWDKEFVIDVTFLQTPQKVKGRVACGWSEYESGRVGLHDGIESTIPAYEEALRFLPPWATLTKLTDGLVEVWSAFEV